MKRIKDDDSGVNISWTYMIWYFFVLCIVLNIVIFSFFYYLENNLINVKRKELENHAKNTVNIETSLLGKEFDSVLSDLNFLYSNYKDRLDSQEDIYDVSMEWLRMSNSRKIYDHIRYIDNDGDEIIRVNYSENEAYLTPADKLQNKKDRYYFYETIDLKEGQVYISKLDLNVENGEIEIPIKPMIRFSIPVYNEKNELKGIIVLNYLADDILKEFKYLAQIGEGNTYLLDSNGYWLSSDDPSQEWIFMYDSKNDVSFKNSYPKEWANLDYFRGQFISDNGMFTYSKIVLKDKFRANKALMDDRDIFFSEGTWIIVSLIRSDSVNGYLLSENKWDIVKSIAPKYLVYFISIFAVSALISFFTYLNKLAKDRIRFYSEYDPLTKVFNRRAGIEKLKDNIPKDTKRRCRICISFIDINGLKQVNDKLGHKMGDELIITVVNIINKAIRKEDYIIRMGGDEFVIVIGNANYDEAENIWNRIIKMFEHINISEDRPYIISVSQGMVELDEWKDRDLEDVIKIADEKMYSEKRKIKVDLRVIK